jgi:excisionase family DNA binding protein
MLIIVEHNIRRFHHNRHKLDGELTMATDLGFFTTRGAAERLGVTINAVKAWIRAAELPALRTPGGHHRIAATDLRAFEARLRRIPIRSGRAPARVLIAEDDDRLAVALHTTLEREWPEATIEVAGDGVATLIQVGLLRPDVLVLDLRMPRLDGFEVCRRLRLGPSTRGIRILAISAGVEEGIRERILAEGADDFLEKPFDLSEFRARVRTLLPGPPES